MIFSLTVCCATGFLVFLSVLLKPYIYIKNHRIGLYWIISLFAALLLIFTGNIPLGYLWEHLTTSDSINPIKILILFFSMTALSIFLDEAGFFRLLATHAVLKAGKNQLPLFIILYVVVSGLTVFTSNDVVVLTFTPFICFYAKNANIDPLPYLFAEFVAANTWSMLLIIGNPTNIYLASSAGIDFITYVSKMFLPTLFAGITSFLLLILLFGKRLRSPITVHREDFFIKDKFSVWLGVIHLTLCTILLALSSYVSMEMYLIAAIFALSLFAFAFIFLSIEKKSFAPIKNSLKRLPYESIPFVLSMFILVLSLNYSGITEKISRILLSTPPVYSVGTAGFLFSNIINNIPMSVLFSSILDFGKNTSAYFPNVFAAVAGSNIGAFLSPVGALAGIMWTSILKRFGIDFSFKKFIFYGSILSVPTLFATLFGIAIQFC